MYLLHKKAVQNFALDGSFYSETDDAGDVSEAGAAVSGAVVSVTGIFFAAVP